MSKADIQNEPQFELRLLQLTPSGQSRLEYRYRLIRNTIHLTDWGFSDWSEWQEVPVVLASHLKEVTPRRSG